MLPSLLSCVALWILWGALWTLWGVQAQGEEAPQDLEMDMESIISLPGGHRPGLRGGPRTREEDKLSYLEQSGLALQQLGLVLGTVYLYSVPCCHVLFSQIQIMAQSTALAVAAATGTCDIDSNRSF